VYAVLVLEFLQGRCNEGGLSPEAYCEGRFANRRSHRLQQKPEYLSYEGKIKTQLFSLIKPL
jgi:hypothetical protein